MPNPRYKQAMREALAQARSDVIQIDTLEISHGASAAETKRVDLCFVIDVTGSMQSEIALLSDSLQDTVEALSQDFEIVRFALVSFRDEDDTEIVRDFTTDVDAMQESIDGLVGSGGGDGPENGFGATVLACNGLSWNVAGYGVARHIYLITDNDSHERGSTEAQALSSLQGRNIKFNLGPTSTSSNYNYDGLLNSNQGGDSLTTAGKTGEELADDLATSIRRQVGEGGILEPIFMVYAQKSYDLTLENGDVQTFEPVPFRFTLPGQNNQGLQDLNIAIDNIDKRIGQWIDEAAKYNAPAIARYRPYLSTDLTTPQMVSPIELTITDIKKTETEVSGRASVADIVNLRFLRERYLRSRFPSLGNT